MTQRVSEASALAVSEANDVVTSLQNDTDYFTHEERFEAAQNEILQRHRESIPFRGFQGQFDEQVFSGIERARANVRINARKLRLDHTRAGLDRSIQLLANEYGLATDQDGKEDVRNRAFTLIRTMGLRGLISQQDVFKMERRFDKETIGGEIREAMRDDAAQAIQDLLNPKGPYSSLSEGELQVWIDRAVAKHESDLREQEALERRAEREAKLAEIAENKAAKSELDTLLDEGRMDEVEARFKELWDVLDSTERVHYRKRIDAGGRLIGETDAGVYVSLEEVVAQGLPITETIDAHYRAGNLSQSNRDQLIKLQDDRRFGDAEEHLKRSLRISQFVQGNARFVQQSASQQALQSFQEWKLAHPEATREEAFEVAQRLIRDSGLIDLGEIEKAQLKPSYAVRDAEGNIDVFNTRAATKAMHDRGEISTFEYEEQVRRIKRIERAQELSRQ